MNKPISQVIINNFKTFFQGNNQSYGQHDYGTFENDKKEIGGKSFTVKDKLITIKEYSDHLSGVRGLGIVPINNENKCKFIVVDIDIYDKKNEQIVINAIQDKDLPFAIFYSKSKGYHLYLFFQDFIPVKEAIKIVDRLIRLLSIDILCVEGNKTVEIFPKQMVLHSGQMGNWINLPYYNCEENCRQTMLYDHRELGIDEALIIIKAKKVWTEKTIAEYMDNLYFSDAPPCLQSLYYLNAMTNNRNSYLFSFGVYFKKLNEDSFEQKLFDLNRGLVMPIEEEELEKTVVSSIRKKGYGYKCKEDPCVSYCNKTECRKRKYGIGSGGYVTELDFGQMQQIATDPPYYEWEINDKQIRFKNEDDILNQSIFRKLCMRKLHYAPYRLKDEEWIKIVNNSLANVEVVEVSIYEDISPMAVLRDLFTEFILKRAMATSRDQINMGRVYDYQSRKKYCFRAKDLMQFVFTQKQFKHFTHGEIHGFLTDIGASFMRIKTETERQSRVYAIDYAYFEKIEEERFEETVDINFTPEEIIQANLKDEGNYEKY